MSRELDHTIPVDVQIDLSKTILKEGLLRGEIFRTGKYSAHIRKLVGDSWIGNVKVVFTVTATPRGKFSGQPHIVVEAGGAPVGEIPAQFQPKLAELSAAVLAGKAVHASAKLLPGRGSELPTVILIVDPT